MNDANNGRPVPGQPHTHAPEGSAPRRRPGIPHLVAGAIPCAIGLVLILAGVDAPSRDRGAGPSNLQRSEAAAAVATPSRDELPQPGFTMPRLEAEFADRHGPVALGGDIVLEGLRDQEPSAELDVKQQNSVDKLLSKIAKQETKISTKQEQIATYDAELALAQQALLDAEALPQSTPAEIKARDKAIKKAHAALLKWQKKIDKANAKIDVSEGKIVSYQAQIEELDPGNDAAGGDPGDETPPPDQDGNGDDGQSTPSGGVVSVPLIVKEALPSGITGLTRTGAISTFGIPFAESDQVGTVNGRPALSVLNSETWQFRALATWPSGYVKWALVDVAADVPAGGANTSLEILNGVGRSSPDDIAFDNGNLITVNTGDLVMQISKTGFDVFHQVWVGGTQIVAAGASGGIVGVAVDGTTLIVPKPGSVTVVVEENGPARAVVRADGMLHTLSGQDLFDFTCRIIARAGSNDVQVDFTVRNANINMPHHVVIDSLGIVTRVTTGADAVATLSKHNGPLTSPMAPSDSIFLHQAQSSAYAYNTVYTMLGQDGYQIVKNGTPLYALGDKTKYPLHGYADLTGATGGVTVAYKDMPYKSPASLEMFGNGDVLAGLFSSKHEPGHFWTFTWRQHESRTVSFSFHAGQGGNPAAVATALDLPVVGRAADYLQYDRTKVLPYRLVTLAQENQAFAAMGLNYSVSVHNLYQVVTRYLYAHETGGNNNHDSVERQLGGEWLRQGYGGQYLTGLDLALYKSEWQIRRSDNFLDKNDPGPANPELPHESGFEGDYEHRYLDGIILAYWLTGDPRFRDALFDDGEILNHLYFYAQERGMVQSLRAIALVGEFTGDPGGLLKAELKAWLQTYCTKIVDITVPDPYLIGWGWQAAPGQGTRRFFATNVGANSAPPQGENYTSRGFFAASLAPLGMYHAARWLGTADPQGALARARLSDLAYFTREELYPYKANPAARYLTYNYGMNSKQSLISETTDFHPLMLGFGEAFKDSGDVKYMQRAVEEFEGFAAHDNGEYSNNLYNIETRLDVQHFLRTYLDWIGAGQN